MSKKPFKLVETLEGHEDDVRGISYMNSTTIASCSRDATVRVWMKTAGTADAKSKFDGSVNSHTAAFVNSIAYLPPSNDHPNGLIVSGGQDALIDVREPGSQKNDADYLLVGHSGNVCALDVKDNTLISGSWDCTAIVWRNWEKRWVLEGHTASVWAVLVISDNEFLTGSADKKIRWFREDKQIRSIEAHPEPVRGLCRMQHGGFASCGNDGTIRTWTLDGQPIDVIYGHTSFIYSIDSLPSGELVSSGEDRTVKVWKGTACLQTITLPAISVWCVSVCQETGDIATGSSDRLVRVFSRKEENWADEETLKAFDEVVAGSAIPEQQVGQVNKESLPGHEALRRLGKHDGETIMINGGENVEAYRWSDAEKTWSQVGVVTGAVSTGRKQTLNGVEYDYIFDVDIEEGKPPRKLPYNVTQNPFDAARLFLENNELPMSYLETTANFIVSNTGGAANIGQTQQPSAADPYGIESRYRPGDSGGFSAPPPPAPKKPSILPQKSFLDIATANLDTVSKKVNEINNNLQASNDKGSSLNPEEIQALNSLIGFLKKPSAPTSTSARSSRAVLDGLFLIVKIVKNWSGPSKLPGLDLLRLLARYSPAVPLYNEEDQNILIVLQAGGAFDEALPNNIMLGTRVFANMFHTSEGLEYVDQNYEKIVSTLHPLAVKASNRNLKVSYSTLLLNYAVHFRKSRAEARAVDLMDTIASTIKSENDPETIYRYLVALGTIICTSDSLEKAAKDICNVLPIVKNIDARMGSSEKRIHDLVEEIDGLLS